MTDERRIGREPAGERGAQAAFQRNGVSVYRFGQRAGGFAFGAVGQRFGGRGGIGQPPPARARRFFGQEVNELRRVGAGRFDGRHDHFQRIGCGLLHGGAQHMVAGQFDKCGADDQPPLDGFAAITDHGDGSVLGAAADSLQRRASQSVPARTRRLESLRYARTGRLECLRHESLRHAKCKLRFGRIAAQREINQIKIRAVGGGEGRAHKTRVGFGQEGDKTRTWLEQFVARRKTRPQRRFVPGPIVAAAAGKVSDGAGRALAPQPRHPKRGQRPQHGIAARQRRNHQRDGGRFDMFDQVAHRTVEHGHGRLTAGQQVGQRKKGGGELIAARLRVVGRQSLQSQPQIFLAIARVRFQRARAIFFQRRAFVVGEEQKKIEGVALRRREFERLRFVGKGEDGVQGAGRVGLEGRGNEVAVGVVGRREAFQRPVIVRAARRVFGGEIAVGFVGRAQFVFAARLAVIIFLRQRVLVPQEKIHVHFRSAVAASGAIEVAQASLDAGFAGARIGQAGEGGAQQFRRRRIERVDQSEAQDGVGAGENDAAAGAGQFDGRAR